MKLVDHPNIVKAEAFAEDDKYIYIVTESWKGEISIPSWCRGDAA